LLVESHLVAEEEEDENEEENEELLSLINNFTLNMLMTFGPLSLQVIEIFDVLSVSN
jgi:hypothetical protein